MLILHAALIEDELLLWGEQPLEANTRPNKHRKHSPKVVRPAAFPYGTPGQELLTALHNSGYSVLWVEAWNGA